MAQQTQPEIVKLVEAGDLTDMLAEALREANYKVHSLTPETIRHGGEGKTIINGTAKVRGVESHEPPLIGRAETFSFEVNAGSSKDEPVILGTLEVVIDFE